MSENPLQNAPPDATSFEEAHATAEAVGARPGVLMSESDPALSDSVAPTLQVASEEVDSLDCVGSQSCEVAPASKAVLGERCVLGSDCASGLCEPGLEGVELCCERRCEGPCEGCGDDGRCVAAPSEDPRCSGVMCPADEPCRRFHAVTPQDCDDAASCAVCSEEWVQRDVPCGGALRCDGYGQCQRSALERVAAGSRHTCAIAPTGAVRCWGANDLGQLGRAFDRIAVGDDERPGDLPELELDFGEPVVGLSAGRLHTCALFGGGGVRCWGGAPVPEAVELRALLGTDALVLTPEGFVDPLKVGNVRLRGPAVRIRSGRDGSHTCALLEDGAVSCWGYGARGRLGIPLSGDSVGPGGTLPTVALPDGVPAIDIGVSNGHACAVLNGGTVSCWGVGTHGQLGYGDDRDRPTPGGPVDVEGRVRRLALGARHTCVLLENREVSCWGDNSNGQLGYGHTLSIGDDETPTEAARQAHPLGSGFVGGAVPLPVHCGLVQLVAFGDSTCALTDTSRVHCWGDNGEGQLGYGHTRTLGSDSTFVQRALSQVAPLGGEVAALGEGGRCAVLFDGSLRCFGDNSSGELGLGVPEFGARPSRTLTPERLGAVPYLPGSAGASDRFPALEAPTAACDDGVRGAPARLVDLASCATPPAPPPERSGPRVIDVALGLTHTCALLEGGSVRCFGGGHRGQLGYGDVRDQDSVLPSALGAIELGGAALQVVAGNAHSCALLENASVRCWGDNRLAQLGFVGPEAVGDDELPVAHPVVPLPGDAVELAAHLYGTCAVMRDGSVQCWGGVPGLPAPQQQAGSPVTSIDLGAPAQHVAMGQAHACAALVGGAVKCWGSNGQGRLGYLDTRSLDATNLREAPPVPLGGLARGVVAGALHTCAPLVGGGLQCWGSNREGQAGHEGLTSIGRAVAPASLGIALLDEPVAELAVGEGFSCFRSEAGAVRCWGRSDQGQLGLGTTEGPVALGDACPVALGAATRKLVASRFHICAISELGNLICWGAGDSGQLGHGNRETLGDDELPIAAGAVSF